MTPFEIVAVVVSFAGIWLTAKRNMLCWPANFVACALYFKLFLDVRLYADMVLQALFAIAIVYGWLAWARGKDDSDDVVVEPLRPSRALPWADATLSSFSLVAQYWVARRHAANWLLWIVVDVLYVGMFAYKGLVLTAGLYAAMVVLAVIGYRRWQARPPG
jgi:nicotinamide mononucleotide transporter